MSHETIPPLKALYYFKVAARTGSFKTAAAQLFVTQAAISQQIRGLEDYLGVKLFYRQTRQVALTPAAQKLLPLVEDGFNSIQHGIKQLTSDHSPNLLRISAVHSFCSLWLMPNLADFQSQYPDIQVQISPSNVLTRFDDEDIDLAIRMGMGGYEGLHDIKLFEDTLIFVVSPILLNAKFGKATPSASDIFALPWIEDPSSETKVIFSQACRYYGIDQQSTNSVVRSDNSMIMIENTLAGNGVAFVNRSLVAPFLKTGQLVQALDFEKESPWALYLVAPPQHFSWLKIHAFQQWITERLRST
jgi:LysR family glycine cleavage system transcriptional activator